MTESTEKTEHKQMQYKGIDIMKFIMALLVIVLHTHPFYGMNQTCNFITADVLGRLAVPFFFAATGFLLEKKLENNTASTKQVVGRYVLRLLKLYLIWTVVYLPIIIYSKIICSERGITYGIFATVRDFVFCGSYAHLWYLPAAAVGVALVFLGFKKLGVRKTMGVLFVLYLAGLLTQS